MTCVCATVHVGNTPAGKNWNPDCPEHPWDARLQAQSDRAAEMQLRAAEARRQVRMAETAETD
jgi:hypothetical protein